MSGQELVVKVADLAVGVGDDRLVTIGLGSCVAIVLHDPEGAVGGLAHVLLPSSRLTRRADNPAKFPETAVPALLERMLAAGAIPHRIRARLVGGASMFANLAPAGSVQMGERNVIASRLALRAHGVPIVAEAVGGTFGRTVRFAVRDGRCEITSVAHGLELL